MDSPIPPWMPAVKGAAATILLALIFQAGPLKRDQLAKITGYNRSTLTDALRSLIRQGLVVYAGKMRGWQLAGELLSQAAAKEGAQKPARSSSQPGPNSNTPTDEMAEIRGKLDDLDHQLDAIRSTLGKSGAPSTGSRAAPEKTPHPQARSTKTPKSPTMPRPKTRKALENQAGPPAVSAGKSVTGQAMPVVVNSHIHKLYKSFSEGLSSTTNRSPKKSRRRAKTGREQKPTAPKAPAKAPPDLAAGLDPGVVAALRGAGIMLNARTRRMALLPHITSEYVRGHYARLKAEGLENRTGLLVAILESGVAAPRVYPNGHLATCDCEECTRRYRYLYTGLYSK